MEPYAARIAEIQRRFDFALPESYVRMLASLGRLPHQLFRGLNGVSPVFRPACSRSCYTALSIGSFSRLVTRAAVPIATGCNDYFPDGNLTR